MKERPILFSGAMVQAILEGSKTMTRRVVKAPKFTGPEMAGVDFRCPYGHIGDRLWVRETWCPSFAADDDSANGYCYRATNNGPEPLRWKPSILMPRLVSRITLEIINVQVERLQEITEEDAAKEGMEHHWRLPDGSNQAVIHFQILWDSLNGKKYPFSSNPWVWVIGFKRVQEGT